MNGGKNKNERQNKTSTCDYGSWNWIKIRWRNQAAGAGWSQWRDYHGLFHP